MQPSAFLSRVLTDTPGCPDVLALQAIVDAAVELFEYTDAWVLTSDPIRLSSLEDTYEPDAVTGARIGRIKHVWCGARELRFKTSSGLADALPDWQTARSSEPTYYTSPDGKSVRVHPMPFAVNGATITIEASYIPKDDMSGSAAPIIPDDLGIKYRDTIIAGAKARLMAVPERKWSNERLAGYYQGKFDDGKATARIEAMHAGQPGTLTVRPLSFE